MHSRDPVVPLPTYKYRPAAGTASQAPPWPWSMRNGFNIDIADEASLFRTDGKIPIRLESLQGRADWRSADFEQFRQLGLSDPGAWI